MATKVTIQAVADFNQATAALDKFKSTATKGFSSINKVLVGLTAAAGAFAGALALKKIGSDVINLVNDFAELGDNVAKTADKLGLGVESLQELRFAANRTGVEASIFDKALQNLTKKAAESAQGIGEAKAVFEQLGLSAKKNNGELKSSEEIFVDLAGALSKVPEQSERVRIGFKLFEAEGAKVINTLGKGEKGLEALRQEFRDLGGVITNDAARASELYIDSLTNLKVAFSGITKTIATQFLPFFTNAIIAVTQFIKDNNQLIKRDLKSLAQSFIEITLILTELLINVLNPISKTFNFISNILGFLSGLVLSVVSAFFDFGLVDSILSGITDILVAVVELVTLLARGVVKLGTLFPSVFKQFGIDIQSVDEELERFQENLRNFDTSNVGKDISKGLDFVNKEQKSLNKELNKFSNSFSSLSENAETAFDRFQKGLKDTNKDTKNLGRGINSLTNETEKLIDQNKNFNKNKIDLSKVSTQLKQLQSELKNAGKAQLQIQNELLNESIKIIETSVKANFIKRKEGDDLIIKAVARYKDNVLKIEKELRDKQNEINKKKVEDQKQFIDTRNNIISSISTSPINLIFNSNIEEELSKVTPEVQARLKLELEKTSGIAAILGGASSIVKGAAGAASILRVSIEKIVEQYLPGLGKVVGEIFEALSKSPDEVKKLIDEFFTAIPTILQSVLVNIGTLLRSVFENLGPLVQGVFTGLIQGLFSIVDLLVDLPSIIVDTLLKLDQLVLGIVDQVPLIIERLVTEAPRIIEALVRALPFLLIRTQALLPILAIKFVSTLIQNVPSIIEAFVKAFVTEGVPEIVKGLVESFKEAFDVLGDVIRNVVPAPVKGIFGFASGGIVPGVGNSDSVPSMLTPGELVVDRSLTQRLDQFITEASLDRRLSSGNGQPQNLTINLVVGEEQLANVVVGLTQKGFRLA